MVGCVGGSRTTQVPRAKATPISAIENFNTNHMSVVFSGAKWSNCMLVIFDGETWSNTVRVFVFSSENWSSCVRFLLLLQIVSLWAHEAIKTLSADVKVAPSAVIEGVPRRGAVNIY